MASRDEDLDDLEKDLRRPYLHEPDSKPITRGMECWLDQTRMCGAACMAYNIDEVDDEGRAIDGPDRCLVLLSTGAQGAAAVLAVSASVSTLRRAQQQIMQDQAAADDEERNRRGGIPPVPPATKVGK
jgi:hypothetical protein